MLNLNRTLDLVKGGIVNPDKTWQDYLPEAKDWQKTAFLLTGPLIVVAAVGAYLFGLLGSDYSILGRFRPTIVSTFMTMISSAVVAGIVAWIFSALAGVFGGKNDFALGLAATSFAFIPGYVGQALVWFPWIGGLLSLGLSIYGLVLLWRVIPVFLEVPDGKRAGHYILSLLATIVGMAVFAMTLGRMMMPSVAMS